jgi:hypothetical protein
VGARREGQSRGSRVIGRHDQSKQQGDVGCLPTARKDGARSVAPAVEVAALYNPRRAPVSALGRTAAWLWRGVSGCLA